MNIRQVCNSVLETAAAAAARTTSNNVSRQSLQHIAVDNRMGYLRAIIIAKCVHCQWVFRRRSETHCKRYLKLSHIKSYAEIITRIILHVTRTPAWHHSTTAALTHSTSLSLLFHCQSNVTALNCSCLIFGYLDNELVIMWQSCMVIASRRFIWKHQRFSTNILLWF